MLQDDRTKAEKMVGLLGIDGYMQKELAANPPPAMRPNAEAPSPMSMLDQMDERHGKLNIRGIDATIDMSKTRPPGEEPGVGGPGAKRPRRLGSRPVRPGLGAKGRSGGWKVAKAKSKVKSKVKAKKGKPQWSNKDR